MLMIRRGVSPDVDAEFAAMQREVGSAEPATGS
jgi:hypothetical protein